MAVFCVVLCMVVVWVCWWIILYAIMVDRIIVFCMMVLSFFGVYSGGLGSIWVARSMKVNRTAVAVMLLIFCWFMSVIAMLVKL